MLIKILVAVTTLNFAASHHLISASYSCQSSFRHTRIKQGSDKFLTASLQPQLEHMLHIWYLFMCDIWRIQWMNVKMCDRTETCGDWL